MEIKVENLDHLGIVAGIMDAMGLAECITANFIVERGFCFLEDPLFFISSVFVKYPHRVAAMAMVMGLCLLVYSLGQRKLRIALNQAQATIANQLSKPTDRPTLRWVFQHFQAVHLLQITGAKQISNLTEERLLILNFLAAPCQKYYLLC
ncbi:hypothetical protein Pse7367_2644 [Thalassoporum mexicanum PCC 7367]|nr:hypothetical protein Pse7367_2644 [Pseudanabaena sp. PCC 7367]